MSCEPVVPPTAKARTHRTQLMVLGFVHLALAIMFLFVNAMSGIYECIDVAILFCALSQMNFCCLIIYIINITINFFTYFNVLGLLVQTGNFSDSFKTGSSTNTFAITIIILLSVYYIVATFICFYAYREFKGMMFDHGMGGGFGMGGIVNRGAPVGQGG